MKLLETVDGTERPSGVWDYVSPSRLSLWSKCPLAFRLRYLEGIVSPTSPALFVGKMVHAALELFFRHRQLGITLDPSDLAARLRVHWDQALADEPVQFNSVAEEAAAKEQAVALVLAYLSERPAEEPRPLVVEAAMEAPLVDFATGEDLGIPLVGVIDLVLPDAAGGLIVDFKTAARGGDVNEMAHEVQLTSYAYLFRRVTGEQESGLEIRSLIKTKTPRVETHRFPTRSEQHFQRLFALVRAYLDDLDRNRFVYRPGHACSMCEHRTTHCLAWAG